MIFKAKRIGGIFLALAFLIILIINPTVASKAVLDALSICARVILPSLLPFFFICGIINALGIPSLLASLFQKPLRKFLRLNPWAAAPLLLGLLGGYPVGAAEIARLKTEGKISSKEAETLLPICNNTGPAFIIGAVGGIFYSSAAGILLYAAHIFSALTLAKLFSSRKDINFATLKADSNSEGNLISALPESIRSAVDKCLNICGFVIFFSILSSVLNELGLLGDLSLWLSRSFKLEIGFCRCLLMGFLELGGGVASMKALELSRINLSLAAFILGFGSLSVHCQTLAVVSSAKIKCARHFVGRIIHGALSAVFILIFWPIIRT